MYEYVECEDEERRIMTEVLIENEKNKPLYKKMERKINDQITNIFIACVKYKKCLENNNEAEKNNNQINFDIVCKKHIETIKNCCEYSIFLKYCYVKHFFYFLEKKSDLFNFNTFPEEKIEVLQKYLTKIHPNENVEFSDTQI